MVGTGLKRSGGKMVNSWIGLDEIVIQILPSPNPHQEPAELVHGGPAASTLSKFSLWHADQYMLSYF